MAEDSGSDRAFFRVATSLPLRATPVADDAYQGNASEILTRVDPALPDVDVALIGWLDRIERKLDRLLGHYGLSAYSALDERERVPVEISGSGLRFSTQTAFDEGAALLVEFELPETPIRLVRCLARVVHDPDCGEGDYVAVAFEAIRQVDRDAVVAYTLTVQRQAILAGEQGDRS